MVGWISGPLGSSAQCRAAAVPRSSANACKSGCVMPVRSSPIEVDETTLHVYDQRDHLIKNVPRTSRKEVRRHKAYGHTTNHQTG